MMLQDAVIRNPFPGLRAFEEHEDVLFFGREKQVDELLKKLRTTRFLAVIGSSGSGKSSLIKSGLIPALHSGFMSGAGSQWRICSFRPGNDPIYNMAVGLSQAGTLYEYEDEQDFQTYTAINESILRRSSNGLVGAYKQSGIDVKHNLLVLVDQFEELFRFSKYEKAEKDGKRDSVAFINLLLKATEQRDMPIYVVFTMRSDFLGDCTEFRGLPEAINNGDYLVPRMTRDERKEAIVAPIAVAGGTIAPRLLNQLLNDVGDNPDQLPILQHALMRTWEAWVKSGDPSAPVDIEHYEQIGTMRYALSQHAEEAYQELNGDRERMICEIMFKALTDRGADARGIRRPSRLSEIYELCNATPEEVITVINVFRQKGRGFLMPGDHVPLTIQSIIDISHESLMRVWERLSQWVYEEIESAELYLRLSKSAELYQGGKSGLWTNPDLALALKWRDDNHPNATWATRYDTSFERAMQFLDYSKKEYDTEVEKKERKQKNDLKKARRFAVVLGTASILSLFFLVISMNLKFKAEASEGKARENEQIAVSKSREAERQKQIAFAQKKIAEEQKNIAEDQKKQTELQTQIAQKEKQVADANRIVAVQQQQKAEAASVEADKQRRAAVAQEQIAEGEKAVAQKERANAEREKENAERSEKNTRRLRLLSIARAMAIQSVKNRGEGDLPALLALQAYKFNAENNGFENNPDIFNAVSAAVDEKPALNGHKDVVRAIDISPDGKSLVSCSDDGTVRLWNMQDKKSAGLLNMGKLKNVEVRSVTYNASGRYIIAGTVDGKLLVWDITQNNGQPRVIQAHTSIINKVQCEASGSQFVTVSSDGWLKVWDINNLLQPVYAADVHAKLISLCYSRNGDRVAVGSENGSIHIYQTKQWGPAIQVINTDGKSIRALAFNIAGDRLAAGAASGVIRIFSGRDRMVAAGELRGHGSPVNAIVFNPDGKTLATCSYDKTIRIWTLRSPEEPPIIITDNSAWVMDIAFDRNGDRLVSCGADKTVRIFNINQQQLIGRICNLVKRNMTAEEWDAFVGKDIAYEKTCATIR